MSRPVGAPSRQERVRRGMRVAPLVVRAPAGPKWGEDHVE